MARPKGSKNRKPDPEVVPFTGVARTYVCALTHGTYNNFRVATLTIEDGLVVDVKESDAYCRVEAEAKCETANMLALDNLSRSYEDGKALTK